MSASEVVVVDSSDEEDNNTQDLSDILVGSGQYQIVGIR
jgi:hypothetical protein